MSQAAGTNQNYTDRAEWKIRVTGGSRQRTTKWLVRREALDDFGPPPDIDDSDAITAAIRQAFLEYGGGTEAQLTLGANPAAHSYAGAPLSDFNVEVKGVHVAEVDLVYAWSGQNSGNTGQSNLSIRNRSSLKTVTVKNGIENRFVFAPRFEDSAFFDLADRVGYNASLNAATHDGAFDTVLNPNIDGVSQGASISVPTVEFAYTFKLSYEEVQQVYGLQPFGTTDPSLAIPLNVWSLEYEEILAELTGRVNSTPFAGRPAGTVRFEGGSGSLNDLGEMDYSWEFSRQSASIPSGLPPMVPVRYQGQPINWSGPEPEWWTSAFVAQFGVWGSLNVSEDGYPAFSPSYSGYDALSVVYGTKEVDGGVEVSPAIRRAATIGVLPSADLNYLRIPGITPAVAIPNPE